MPVFELVHPRSHLAFFVPRQKCLLDYEISYRPITSVELAPDNADKKTSNVEPEQFGPHALSGMSDNRFPLSYKPDVDSGNCHFD